MSKTLKKKRPLISPRANLEVLHIIMWGQRTDWLKRVIRTWDSILQRLESGVPGWIFKTGRGPKQAVEGRPPRGWPIGFFLKENYCWWHSSLFSQGEEREVGSTGGWNHRPCQGPLLYEVCHFSCSVLWYQAFAKDPYFMRFPCFMKFCNFCWLQWYE